MSNLGYALIACTQAIDGKTADGVVEGKSGPNVADFSQSKPFGLEQFKCSNDVHLYRCGVGGCTTIVLVCLEHLSNLD